MDGADSEGKNQAEYHATDKTSDKHANNLPTPERDNLPKRGFGHVILNVIIAGVFATGVWVIGEHLHDLGYEFYGSMVNFTACIVFLLVLPFEAAKFWPRKQIIWGGFFIAVFLPLAFIFLVLEKKPEAMPHFFVSLQIGDSPDSTVVLTNDFLSKQHIKKTSDLPDGKITVGGFVEGWLVVPVLPEETNKVFTFIVENDSSIPIHDLEGAVVLPKGMKYGLDREKWQAVDNKLTIPGQWKFVMTNLQTWAARVEWTAFPTDDIKFPAITNLCDSTWTRSNLQVSLFEFNARSTGFDEFVAANIVFIPVVSNVFKPFITRAAPDKNGRLDLSAPEFAPPESRQQ